MDGAWIVYGIYGVIPFPLFLCKTEQEAREFQSVLDGNYRSVVRFWAFGKEFGTV